MDNIQPREIESQSEVSPDGKHKQLLKGAWSPAAQKAIRALIDETRPTKEPFENDDIVAEIIVTALKSIEAKLGRGDLKLISRSVRELRYAFKIFKAYRQVRKVTIFGSARTDAAD